MSARAISSLAKAPSTPALADQPTPNLVKKLFDELGALEPLVERRLRQSTKVFSLHAIRPIEAHLPAARARLAQLPDRPTLNNQMADLYRAVRHRAEEGQARMIAAIMLSGIPSAEAKASASFIDALTFCLADNFEDDSIDSSGFSAEVLTSATRRAWREFRFVPSITEFLAIAKERRAAFAGAERVTEWLLRLRTEAEVVVQALGSPEERERIEVDDDDIPF